MTHSYTFEGRMVMSEGVTKAKTMGHILMQNIPGATKVRKANEKDDRNGTDWWVDHLRGDPLSIDAKVRSEDYSVKPRLKDDLALEIWSVIDKLRCDGTREPLRVVGWTLNEKKRTDYVLFFWQDTGRFCLVPFPMLCAVFREHKDAWCDKYDHPQQFTPRPTRDYHGYWSQCVFVPRREVWAAIYRKFA